MNIKNIKNIMKRLENFKEENNLEIFPIISIEGSKSVVRIRFHDICSGEVAEANYLDPGIKTRFFYPKE